MAPTLLDDRLARLVHPAADCRRDDVPVDPEILGQIADGLAQFAATRTDPVPGDPDERRYIRVIGTPAYEAWLIAWPRGTSLDLHDHGGSWGVLRVVRGAVVETFSDGQQPGRLHSHRLEAGDAVVLSPNRVHDVWNPAEEQAVTVHVYSPPLESMTFYDGDLQAVRTEDATTP
jgi:predicted metal-dependent enzyme (double-stranded beta helix superfamily)